MRPEPAGEGAAGADPTGSAPAPRADVDLTVEGGADDPATSGAVAPDGEATRTAAPAADAARAGVDQAIVAAFEAELAEAHRKADESWDRYLRAEAELDNLRKAAERQRADATARVRRDLLGRVLEVADNLERALAHATADPQSLVAGIQATAREVERLLEREGVQRIAAQDAAFDPNLHDAVGLVNVPGLDDEKVISVEQAGYTLNGDLLRPARVIVGRPAEG
ncbi:nucleotide exchange factor GrpE [bacterium]|nr:MAG: nucleotide exchange factor GrpE [bacterium]